MKIKIEKGTIDNLNDCVEALINSELGRRYFEKEGSAQKAIEEAVDSHSFYVAMADTQCAGFFYFLPKGAFHSFPYLHIIAVKKEFRDKGIGRMMMDFFEKIAFEINDRIFLVVADYNPKAKRFYEGIGYKQVGIIPSLYREGIDESLMMKAKD
jgi:ribosomal protein S18 acetylase RimI-like enzyme